ncbi:serine/threonine-protein kinase Chk1-like [Oratosquilla oratoria]|uniref:serine/threonine-protein kinase Chk1-like n=1 Tax=Oratosquilla oratoria TaxID=337810 RepID=UPI003F776CB9
MFLTSLYRGRKSASELPESRHTVKGACRWGSLFKGTKPLVSAFLRCACKKTEVQTPVTTKTNTTILRENELAVEAFNMSDWTAIRKLGRGSFGSVQLMINRRTEELVARKGASESSKPSPVREAVIQLQLRHENIVRLVCWTKTSDKVSLIMEYCSGGTLLKAIANLSQEDVGRYFSQLMSAVNYLHSRGVAHRDLKPENLLLTKEKVLKVADLGFAAVFIVKGKEVTLEECIGTKPYMAPEVLRSQKYAGPPTDLWSCGVILFYMVSKNLPWRIAHPHDSDYKKWADQDVALRQMHKWKKINESPWRTHLEALLSVDPQERLSNWRKTQSHH